MTPNEFSDEGLIKMFAKTSDWYPALAGQMMICCVRAARGVSLKYNLSKIIFIARIWLCESEQEDTKG